MEFYQEMKPKYPGFEVVFMSQDESTNTMEKYISEMTVPWPALRYSAVKSSRGLTKFAGPAFPASVVNEMGEILSDSFEGKTYVGPYKVVNELKKIPRRRPSRGGSEHQHGRRSPGGNCQHERHDQEFGEIPQRGELGRDFQEEAVTGWPGALSPFHSP